MLSPWCCDAGCRTRSRGRHSVLSTVMAIVIEELCESANHPLLADCLFSCLAWFPAIQATILVIQRR